MEKTPYKIALGLLKEQFSKHELTELARKVGCSQQTIRNTFSCNDPGEHTKMQLEVLKVAKKMLADRRKLQSEIIKLSKK